MTVTPRGKNKQLSLIPTWKSGSIDLLIPCFRSLLSVSVCLCTAITCWCQIHVPNLQFNIRTSKSSGQGQDHMEQKRMSVYVVCWWVGLPSTESQSCLIGISYIQPKCILLTLNSFGGWHAQNISNGLGLFNLFTWTHIDTHLPDISFLYYITFVEFRLQ